MFDARKKWPISLAPADEPLFMRIVFLVFIIALLLDAPVTRAVMELPMQVRAPFFYITRLGNSDWILLPSLLVMILAFAIGRFVLKGRDKLRMLTVASVSAFIFCGVALPGIVANLIKRLVGRSRPVNFEENGMFSFDPLVNAWDHQSFPSGDTTTIFALAAVLSFFMPRYTWLWLLGAALVGLSRIMVGVHFPSDVCGGIILGTIGAFAVRNYCVARGWLFVPSPAGHIVPQLAWSGEKEA